MRSADMKRLIMAAVFVLAAPHMVSAQEKKRKSAPSAALDVGQACRILPSAPWVKQQAEWFDESAHAWTHDTLRTALLAGAGLTAPLSAPVQLGVQVSGKGRVLGSSADAMVQQLKTLASARGSTWPTKSVVGAAGVHAVYLLAESDTGLARAALHRLME